MPPGPALLGPASSTGCHRPRRTAPASAGRAGVTSLPSRQLDGELHDLLAQGVPVDSEQRRGADLVPARMFEHGDEQGAFRAFHEAWIQVPRSGVRESAARFLRHELLESGTRAAFTERGLEEGEVLGGQHLAQSQNEGALDRVFELPDVAWPRIRRQMSKRGLCEEARSSSNLLGVACREVLG